MAGRATKDLALIGLWTHLQGKSQGQILVSHPYQTPQMQTMTARKPVIWEGCRTLFATSLFQMRLCALADGRCADPFSCELSYSEASAGYLEEV
jgi:hypothetical protein